MIQPPKYNAGQRRQPPTHFLAHVLFSAARRGGKKRQRVRGGFFPRALDFQKRQQQQQRQWQRLCMCRFEITHDISDRRRRRRVNRCAHERERERGGGIQESRRGSTARNSQVRSIPFLCFGCLASARESGNYPLGNKRVALAWTLPPSRALEWLPQWHHCGM